MVKRYLCICSYDGSNFVGWQIQPNKRSVSEEIQIALKQFHKKDVEICGCSRTDALVHASGQCFHFDSDLLITEDKMKQAINTFLPDDIKIEKCMIVANDFHARYLAQSKEYEYLINNGEYNIFERNHQTFVNKPLDVDKMVEASKVFVGEHDFTSFNTSTLNNFPNQIREIYSIEITKEEDLISIKYHGNGFLRYMVRMISQVLIEVGLDRISISDVKAMLDAKNKQACRYKALPNGLYLRRINYEKS